MFKLYALFCAAANVETIYEDADALVKDLQSARKLTFGGRVRGGFGLHFDPSRASDKQFLLRCASLLERATNARAGLTPGSFQDDTDLVYVESFTDACLKHGESGAMAEYEARLTTYTNDRDNTAAKSMAHGRREMRKVKDEFYEVLTKEFKPELQSMIVENSLADDKAVMAIVESLEKSVSAGTQPGDLNLIEFWKTFRSAPSQKFTDIKHVIKEFYRMKPLVEEALDKSGVISDKYRGNAQERDFDIVEGSRTTGGRVFTLNRDTTEFARLDMLDLLMHEANPGHHLERWYSGAHRARGKQFVEVIRRQGAMTNAFVEGWAHYIERFILDEPAFKTAYLKQFSERDFIFQKLGTFQWLMFRCARLIVDPLLNENGQNPSTAVREDAIAIMMDSGISLTFAKAQVVRYLGEPGQATAYLSGALIMRRLRRASGMTAATFHGKILDCFGLVAALPACIGVELPPEETLPAGTTSSSNSGGNSSSNSGGNRSGNSGTTSGSSDVLDFSTMARFLVILGVVLGAVVLSLLFYLAVSSKIPAEPSNTEPARLDPVSGASLQHVPGAVSSRREADHPRRLASARRR